MTSKMKILTLILPGWSYVLNAQSAIRLLGFFVVLFYFDLFDCFAFQDRARETLADLIRFLDTRYEGHH